MKRPGRGKTQGRAPEGRDWIEGPLFLSGGASWRLHLKAAPNPTGWLDLKLQAQGMAQKANYPLGWSAEQMRFASDKHLWHLKRERPVLFDKVERWLIENRGVN
jgi:hypothetical protein